MKHLKSFTSLLLIFFSLTLVAQRDNWCATDQELQRYFDENPGMEALYLQDQQLFNQKADAVSGDKAAARIIPVVVHVIHHNGVGNISKAQIEDGIRILNEDFQKLNSDTNQIRSVFQSHAGNASIAFRLARIDPNGNCTEGITRTNSFLTYNKRNEPKALSYWDASRYLNVWLVNSITGSGRTGGTVLGFAQFPSPASGALQTYGLVCRNDEWGQIGTGAGSGGRTPTHEVGHCFNLLHTFQSGCGSVCNATGDFVCDTPPAANSTFGCNQSNNTCSNDASGSASPYTSNVPDQLENYMSYDDCQHMFTAGQVSRMNNAFGFYSKLITLSAPSNAVSTGTNDGYVSPPCKPIAEIIMDEQFVCSGGQITFSDNSYNGTITGWNWSFPGGTPSTSTSATPTITYNSAGDYDISLIVSTAGGSDTVTLSNVVHVSPATANYAAANYVENFDNLTQFNNDWATLSPTGSPVWAHQTFATYTGAGALWINNFTANDDGEEDFLISPTFDMTTISSGHSLNMRIAYQRRTSTSDDPFTVWSSIDCGQTWQVLFTIGPSFYAFDNSTSNSNYLPTNATQWKLISIPSFAIPSSVTSSNNARFMFEFEAGGGNNFYFDEFSIGGTPIITSIEEQAARKTEMFIYPNPTNNISNIVFEVMDNVDTKLYVTDLLGKEVMRLHDGAMSKGQYRFNLPTADLESGVYLVSLEVNGERSTQKLFIQ